MNAYHEKKKYGTAITYEKESTYLTSNSTLKLGMFATALQIELF